MQNEMKVRLDVGNAARVVLVCAGVMAATAAAGGQAITSDAQVESNVLRALAGAPELASQAITTKTVYGTVTLSGSVTSEPLRLKAETLASTSPGVKKVVDELVLGDGSSQAGPVNSAADPHAGMVLQSDGTYAAAPAEGTAVAHPAGTAPGYQRNNPDDDQALDAQAEHSQSTNAGVYSQPDNAPPNRRPLDTQSGQYGYPPGNYPQGNYPQQTYPQGNYPQQGYPPVNNSQGTYSQEGDYARSSAPSYAAPMDGGQVAGESVTIPAGTLIRVRVDQPLSSTRSQPGDVFQGVIMHDIVAGNAIAIPRGASVQGRIVDSRSSGVLKGRGELSLQLTQVTLAGHNYPVFSDQWAHNGGDKTIQTVNRTAGLGAFGAIVGAVAGGGEGAAIGAGVGAAAGLGSSAASGRGQVFIPAEAVVTFHLAQPANVRTVSEQEMQRLAYGVPAGQRAPRPRAYQTPYGAPPYGYGYPY